jgi:hypothetical protein
VIPILKPHVIVEIDGRRYDSWENESLIIEATVELTSDKSSEATISVSDSDFKFTDRHLVSDGLRRATARFWMGFGNEQQLGEPLFKGMLARAEYDNQVSKFCFHDKSSEMRKEKKARYHNRMTYLQILRKLARENGLQFVGPTSADEGEVFDSIMQDGKTDWEFARKIARRAGLRLFVRGDTLFAVEANRTSAPVATINYPEDFLMLRGFGLSYKLPENKHGRPRKVQMRGRGRSATRLSGDAESGSRGTVELGLTEDLPKHTAKAAKHRAKASRESKREHAFEHHVSLLPVYEGGHIHVESTIMLTGLGEFYSGKYLVTESRYSSRPGNLTNELTLGRDIK